MTYEGKHSPKITPEVAAKRNRSRRLSNIFLVVGIVLIAVALVGFGNIFYNYHKGDATYADIASMGNQTVSDQAAESYQMDIDWDALREVNPDIVGWLQIPDTVVDYPVVQGKDNDYYLHHDFEGNSSSFGCLFMDYACAADLSGWNTLIYGHHMRNGSMLATLVDYTDPGFLEAHPYVYYATPDGVTHRLKVFCVVKAAGSEALRQTQFSTEGDYRGAVQNALDRNMITTDITAGQVNHLFGLITCSYEFEDARTLVYCVEVDVTGTPVV